MTQLSSQFIIRTFFQYCKRPIFKKNTGSYNSECPYCHEGKSTGKKRRFFYIPENDDVYRLRSNSVMWQKERLINYGLSKLPAECKYFAWIDCDVMFHADDWCQQACEKLKTADVIQLFKKVFYMP